jgi:hypothetical protein
MPAGTVTALDIAFRRHCQMDTAIFTMISAKTGVSLEISSLITFCRHLKLPSAFARFLDDTKRARQKLPTGSVAFTIKNVALTCCFFSWHFACQILIKAEIALFQGSCALAVFIQNPCCVGSSINMIIYWADIIPITKV